MAKRSRVVEEIELGPSPSERGGVDVLRVEVAYELGGLNWFHGSTDPRGYVLRATVVTKVNGMTFFRLGSGYKTLIEPAKAFSPKKLVAIMPPPDTVEKLKAAALRERADEEARNALRRANAP